jgi:hypothetical protein
MAGGGAQQQQHMPSCTWKHRLHESAAGPCYPDTDCRQALHNLHQQLSATPTALPLLLLLLLVLQSLQARRASAPSGTLTATDGGATVAGASHIQQIHIGSRSPLAGRSPRGSPPQGRSPRGPPLVGRSPWAGATAEVAVVTPGVASSIPSSATASVSSKSVASNGPVGPPVTTRTSEGMSGWLWGNRS